MAARLCPDNVRQSHQSLHHVVAHAPWSDEDLLEAVRQYTLPAMQKQGPIVAWVVDDTGLVKEGTHSVGVTRQYCGPVGKQENCRVAVSLSLSTAEASLPIACNCTSPKFGPRTRNGECPRAYLRKSVFKPSRKSRCNNSARLWIESCHMLPCWPTPPMATTLRFAMASPS